MYIEEDLRTNLVGFNNPGTGLESSSVVVTAHNQNNRMQEQITNLNGEFVSI